MTVIAGREDRVFPVEFQQDLARTRLGVDAVIVPGGHLAALSHPVELTDAILASMRRSTALATRGRSPAC